MWARCSRLALSESLATIVRANANAAPVQVRAVLDRATAEFGDPVTATVTVFLDPSTTAPDVRLEETLARSHNSVATRVTR